ncbi:MAG: SCO family protein [Roseobacter sp.]
MNPRFIALFSVAAVVGVMGGFWIATQGSDGDDQFAQCRASTVAGGAGALGGPFELLNASGDVVTDADVITEPSVLYFGYTFCPDVCPLDVARNAVAVDVLEERGMSVTPVFISIDPKRDTPEVVGDFAANMHDRMIGLTGSPEQVKAASQAYRTYYRAQDGDEDYYLVDHSTFSYLVLPEHGFVEFFRREISPEQMADTVACFVENA